jgi:TrmH family RNA methyltransferase
MEQQMTTTTITSTHNPRIQHIRALLNQRSARDKEKAFVIEGVRLCEEALAAGCVPNAIFVSPTLNDRGRELVETAAGAGTEICEVPEFVMEALSATENSQGVLMELPQQMRPLSQDVDFVLIMDQVRDPGNMGTILRSAAASGVQAVFLPGGNTDIFAPKVVRAGMGAHFRLCLEQREWPEVIRFCKEENSASLHLMLAESGEGIPYWQMEMRQPLALVIGGEADGACPEAKLAIDSFVNIPMPGKFESLNAAVAAGILLFEVVRQRSNA